MKKVKGLSKLILKIKTKIKECSDEHSVQNAGSLFAISLQYNSIYWGSTVANIVCK